MHGYIHPPLDFLRMRRKKEEETCNCKGITYCRASASNAVTRNYCLGKIAEISEHDFSESMQRSIHPPTDSWHRLGSQAYFSQVLHDGVSRIFLAKISNHEKLNYDHSIIMQSCLSDFPMLCTIPLYLVN